MTLEQQAEFERLYRAMFDAADVLVGAVRGECSCDACERAAAAADTYVEAKRAWFTYAGKLQRGVT